MVTAWMQTTVNTTKTHTFRSHRSSHRMYENLERNLEILLDLQQIFETTRLLQTRQWVRFWNLYNCACMNRGGASVEGLKFTASNLSLIQSPRLQRIIIIIIININTRVGSAEEERFYFDSPRLFLFVTL